MIKENLDRLESIASSAWNDIDRDYIDAWKQSPVTKALLKQLDYEYQASVVQIVDHVAAGMSLELVGHVTAQNVARALYIEYIADLVKEPEQAQQREEEDGTDTVRAPTDY